MFVAQWGRQTPYLEIVVQVITVVNVYNDMWPVLLITKSVYVYN